MSLVGRCLKAASVLALAAFALAPAVQAQDALTLASFGGSYGESQTKAYLEPFQQETGIRVNMVDYNGGLGEIRAQVETGNVTWDVVDVEMQDLVRGCDDGLFEKVADIELPAADGAAAQDDFIDGTLHECGVGTIVWSMIVAYDEAAFPADKRPATLADFFDVAAFPGKRGVPKKPQAILEWALVADGVEADKVYEVLATPEGVDRALAKLDVIRDQIVWWDAHAQAPQLLADKEVTMTVAANGRIFTAAREGKPFKVIWDRQLWVQEFWAITKGTRNLDKARSFITFASRPDRMAAQAGLISYGPARKSAAALVTGEMRDHMPTEASNFATAIRNDVEFWADHGDTITERFNVWLNR